MVDSSTNQPIDALDSVKMLLGVGAKEELAKSGLVVSSITSQVMQPRPQGGGGESKSKAPKQNYRSHSRYKADLSLFKPTA